MSANALLVTPTVTEPRESHLRAVETELSEVTQENQSNDTVLTGLPSLTHRLVGTIAVFAFEAVEGTRHVGQLGKWISFTVAQELAEYRALTIERRTLYRDVRRLVPTARKVRISQPARGVSEATVVLEVSGRCRAVALRFEVIRGRWQATSITIL
ncbi:MAG: Rv3235 family protein [Leucobacter sp.]